MGSLLRRPAPACGPPVPPACHLIERVLGSGGTTDPTLVDRFEFGLILDADSSLRPAAPFVAGGTDVVRRLVAALTAPSGPHLIQCMLNMLPGRTFFGLLEHIDGLLSDRFFRALGRIFRGHSPFFGHNAIFRLGSYLRFMDLRYISHDMIESARLATAGFPVQLSPGAVISESPEEPLCPHWMRRDIRWALGSAQWFTVLLSERLDWRPRLYLIITLAQYCSSLVGIGFLFASVGLARAGHALHADPGGVATTCGIVLLAGLVGLNLAQRVSLRYPLASVLASFVRLFMAPAMLFLRTLSWLLAGLTAAVWIPRPCRELPSWLGVAQSFLWLSPLGLAGGGLLVLLSDLESSDFHWGLGLLRLAGCCLFVSPWLAAFLALPVRAADWITLRQGEPERRAPGRPDPAPRAGWGASDPVP
jgi:hypothetical protein